MATPGHRREREKLKSAGYASGLRECAPDDGLRADLSAVTRERRRKQSICPIYAAPLMASRRENAKSYSVVITRRRVIQYSRDADD
jgi:hypothetical protein